MHNQLSISRLGVLVFFIGSIYPLFSQQDESKPITTLLADYNEAVKSKNENSMVELAEAIALEYWLSNDPDSALIYFKEAASANENINNQRALHGNLSSIGLIYFDEANYSEALKYFQASLKITQTLGLKTLEAEAQINIGECQFKLGKERRAFKPLEEGLAIAIELDDVKLRERCYYLLYELYTATGDEIKAKDYLDSYMLLKKNAENEHLAKNRAEQMRRMSGQLSEVEAENEAAKNALMSQHKELNKTKQNLQEFEKLAVQQQLQVNLLNTEKELREMTIKAQEADLKSSRMMIYSFVVGFILVSALVVVIFMDNKKKKQARKIIEEQHLNIKSSINYAQRIQGALMPQNGSEGNFIKENTFILFKPRDVVSGDFYWYKKLNDRGDLAIAAVDCTGHGIPGAFMSMIGLNALNGIVNRGVHSANRILDLLHMEIRASLKQEETGNNDGMDMALCIIKKAENKIEYAGAKNSLLFVQNGEVVKVKADAHPIGGGKYSKVKPYTKHEIDITGDMMLYLFSDGFQDQFGGPENMKFMTKKFREHLHEIHELPLEEQKNKLNNTIEGWKGNLSQTDDILVIGVKINT